MTIYFYSTQNDDTCTQNQVFTYVLSIQKCACVDLKDARQLTAAAFEKPAFNPNPHKPVKPDAVLEQDKPAEVEDSTDNKRQTVLVDPVPVPQNDEESTKPDVKPLPGGVHSSSAVEKQSEVQVEEVQVVQEGEKRPAVVGELKPEAEVAKPLENERKRRQTLPVAHGDPLPAFQGEQGSQPELVVNEEPQQVQGVKPLPGGFHQNIDNEQKKRQSEVEGEDEFQSGHQRPAEAGQQRPAVIGQNRPSPLPQFDTVPDVSQTNENERKKRQDGSEEEPDSNPEWGKKEDQRSKYQEQRRQRQVEVEPVELVPLPVEDDYQAPVYLPQSTVQSGSINDQKKRQTVVAAAAHQGERQVYPAVPAVCADEENDKKKRQTEVLAARAPEDLPSPTQELVHPDAEQPETIPAEVDTWIDPKTVPVHPDEVVSFGNIDQIKDRQDDGVEDDEDEATDDDNQEDADDKIVAGVQTGFGFDGQGINGQNRKNIVVVDDVDQEDGQIDVNQNQDVLRKENVANYQNVGVYNVEKQQNAVQYQSLQPQEVYPVQS